MNASIVQHETDPNSSKRETRFLYALSAAADLLQQAVWSEQEIFRVFQEQIAAFGFQGVISMFNVERNTLTLRALAVSEPLRAEIAKAASRPLESSEMPVERVDIYRQVIESGKPAYLPDNQINIEQVLQRSEIPASFSPTPAIYAPIIIQGQVAGMLTVLGAKLREDDLPLISTFANHIAAALTNARLLAVTRQQAEQLEALYKVSQNLVELRSLDRVLYRVVREAMQLMNSDQAGMYLYRPERDVLEWVIAVGKNAPPVGTLLERGEGLSGKIWDSGKPIAVEDYGEWSGHAPRLPHPRVHVVGVPIKRGDEFLGVINIAVDKDTRAPYTADDINLLVKFAAQAAIAIQNARSFDETRRKTQELTALYDAALTIGAVLDTQTLLKRLYGQVRRLMQPDSFGVYFYYADHNEYEIAMAIEEEEVLLEIIGKRFSVDENSGLTGWVARTRQPLLIHDMVNDPLPVTPIHISGPVARSWLGVPLIARDRFIGVISPQSFKPHAFDESDLRFLEMLAAQAAVALENARLYEQAQQEIAERKRAESALAKSEIFNRRLIENAPVGIVYLEADGTVKFSNPALHKIIVAPEGTPLPVIGKPIAETTLGLDVEFLRLAKQVLAGETVNNELVHVRSAIGQALDLEVYGDPLMDQSGQQEGAILMVHDVTGHKRAERLQNAIYQISEAVYATQDLTDLFTSIHKVIQQLMPAKNFYIAMYDESSNMVNFMYVSDEKDKIGPAEKLGNGLTAYVLRSGEPLLATPSVFSRLIEKKEIEPLGTSAVDWLGVPLKIADRVVGVLAVQTYDESIRLEPRHKDILTVVSAQVAMAIERKQTEEHVRRRNRELALLNQIIGATAYSRSSDYILEIACQELARAFNMPQAVATLLDKSTMEVVLAAEYHVKGFPPVVWDRFPVQGNPFVKNILIKKAPIIVEDVQNDPHIAPVRHLITPRGTVSMMLLPLIVEGEAVGSLSIGSSEPHHFTANEVNLAWSVADQVAGVLARAQLDESRRMLSTAIEQAAEGVIVIEARGTIRYVNPAFGEITGYAPHDVVGQPFDMLGSEAQNILFEEIINTVKDGNVWSGRFSGQKYNGETYFADMTITPVRDENRRVVRYVGVMHDVTHELLLERQYYQAQKMDAIGQLTGGIAHDFNNILTAINGFASLLQVRLLVDDPRREMVDKILDSGQRAADLVNQLMAFSRKQLVEPQKLNLNSVVTQMQKMLQRIIGENIQFNTWLHPALWTVKIDPVQIEQVILNLAVNARDAMPNGGTLTVETANETLDQSFADDHFGVTPGKYVLLAVSDTGVGMDKDVQEHIFEPFFSTKEKGKGTGLGLATVFGIVTQNGGTVWVYSEKELGTTFKIYFPIVKDDTVDNFTSLESPVAVLPTGSETILLVEDDEVVRELTCQILQEQGYTVLMAENGKEALQVAAEYQSTIHLLLTDVIMSGMTGKVLAEKMMQQYPQTKIIFMSGYTDDAIAHHGVLSPDVSFLPKPFSVEALTFTVREVLDK